MSKKNHPFNKSIENAIKLLPLKKQFRLEDVKPAQLSKNEYLNIKNREYLRRKRKKDAIQIEIREKNK